MSQSGVSSSAAAQTAQSASSATPVPVILVLASGPARGGGIGQVVRFLLAENENAGALDVVGTVDPRGPGHWAHSLWRVPAAILHLAALRFGRGAEAVAHVHMAGRMSTARKTLVMAAAHVLGVPVVLHYHEYGYAQFLQSLPGPARAWVRFVLRRCRAHIVLGPVEKERLPPALGVPPDRFHVIANGVPAALASLPRAEPENPIEIVFVGALSDRKGVPELIAAAAALPKSTPWRLVFCGPGDIAERTALAEAAGIADRCQFLGLQDNTAIQNRLRQSAIFVLPSHAEGFAIALLEAMAAGCGVIATLVGEQKQALRHEHNALVVEPGDIDGLRDALARLIEDKDLRARIGQQARTEVQTTFNTAAMLRRCADVLAAAAPKA